MKVFPRRVRGAGAFTAPDPWNGGQVTDFTIGVYKLLGAGVPLPAGMVPRDAGVKDSPFSPGGPPMYGIRSEIDGQERMLPESLAELWQTKRIPAESLPRLLWLMQSSLKKNDYLPILHNNTFLWLAAWSGFFFLCMTLLIVFASHEPGFIMPGVLGAVLLPLPLVLVTKQRRARCRKQMDWALTL